MDRNAIMFRFGGVGDCVSLTAVAKILKDRGYDVTFCIPEVQVPLYKNLDIFKEVKATRRLPHPYQGRDCVENGAGWLDTDVLKKRLHKKDWLILEYRNLVENNSPWGQYPRNKEHLVWNKTMNSNFQNWVDLALAWANIDPTTISDDDKRPIYKIEPEELEWASHTVPKDGFIMINLEASSLARVINSQYDLADKLVERGDSIMIWQDNKWLYRSPNYSKIIQVDSLRQSIALLSFARLLVSTDSGLSHFSEAIGKKQITVYTTVPAWTRSKYYKYTTPLESGVWCSPCFIIGRYCPLIEYEIEENNKGLTTKQKNILKYHKAGMKPVAAAKKLGMSVHGLDIALQSTMKTKEALKNAEPECIRAITMERLLTEIDKCLQE